MKKINSIDYGGKVIGIGLLFLIVFTTVFNLLNLTILSKISVAIGTLILIGFFLYVQLELHQDKKIAAYYKEHPNCKIPLGHGKFECTSCGNRQITEVFYHTNYIESFRRKVP